MEDSKMNRNKYKEIIQEYFLVIQQINKKQEKFLLQESRHLFVDNPITDFRFEGMNKHILISDNFETPNYEMVINVNGYISITGDNDTEWYKVTAENLVNLSYARPVLDFNWDELDIENIINSFTSEEDLHRFTELVEAEVSILKQRLLVLNNIAPKIELIEDEKLIQELSSFREVS